MGTSHSHEYEPTNTTPVRPEQARVLSMDPRSPSVSITRTPIVVGKTPDGMLDPRSPSTDVQRTPLGAVPAGEPLDPRSPTVGIVRTPLTSVTQTQAAVMNPGLCEETLPKLDLSLDTTDLVDPKVGEEGQGEGLDLLDPLCLSEVLELNPDDLPSCESTRLVEKEDKSSVDTTKLRKKKKAKPSQPKELFPGSKKPASTGLKDVTRSPLATRNIDMNSPLKLVQRKQMKDLDLKRTCSLESSRSHFIVKDKENM